jgi:glucose-6-phosphate dehydrogenase assembly protein OpcA
MTTTSPEIRLADIEKELNGLWETQKDKKLIKASLFNLIIYADVKEKSDFLDDMVKTILEKYPCRIIFISGNTDALKNSLRTSVANIIVGKGENAVACDRIHIDVSPQQLHRVPFIIFPLLIPDLPIYLLWGKDPTGEMDILPHLRPYASRLIFDSDSTYNLQDFSRKMLKEIDAGT